MKDLKTLCNVNIPNSLHSLLESSILDIEGTIEDGNKYNVPDLQACLPGSCGAGIVKGRNSDGIVV